ERADRSGRQVPRPVDAAHAATTDLLLELVVAEANHVATSADAVLLHLVEQGRGRDLEDLGCLGAVPVRALERLEDDVPHDLELDLLERSVVVLAEPVVLRD